MAFFTVCSECRDVPFNGCRVLKCFFAWLHETLLHAVSTAVHVGFTCEPTAKKKEVNVSTWCHMTDIEKYTVLLQNLSHYPCAAKVSFYFGCRARQVTVNALYLVLFFLLEIWGKWIALHRLIWHKFHMHSSVVSWTTSILKIVDSLSSSFHQISSWTDLERFKIVAWHQYKT